MNNMPHRRIHGAVALALGIALLLSMALPVAAAVRARPLVGFGTGQDVLGPPIASCPAGSGWYVQENGKGFFTQLGSVKWTYHQCAAADLSTGYGWTTAPGSMTITAANGDQLLLSYEMRFRATPLPIPTTAQAQIKWTVAGGSGRFAGARGFGGASIAIRYTPDLTGATSSSIWWGSIIH